MARCKQYTHRFLIIAVEFYSTTNLLYGVISEFCTPNDCPLMSAGEKYTYLWKDAEGTNPKYKKPTEVCATEYVALLMEWVEQLINNPEIFPSDPKNFKKTFIDTVKKIFNKLFRVYAHLYYSHFDEIMDMGIDKHLNTAFKHFMLFSSEFQLVEKNEMAPMEKIIADLMKK